MRPVPASLALLAALAVPAGAADDPSIRGELRRDIRSAMESYIAAASVGGVLRHYDPVEGSLLELELEELHAGIVRKGGFYVSCADFRDTHDRRVDLDFLVLETAGGLRVTQAIVHKTDGVERPYHLESE